MSGMCALTLLLEPAPFAWTTRSGLCVDGTYTRRLAEPGTRFHKRIQSHGPSGLPRLKKKMIEISILKKQIKPCLGEECLRFCVLLQ